MRSTKRKSDDDDDDDDEETNSGGAEVGAVGAAVGAVVARTQWRAKEDDDDDDEVQIIEEKTRLVDASVNGDPSVNGDEDDDDENDDDYDDEDDDVIDKDVKVVLTKEKHVEKMLSLLDETKTKDDDDDDDDSEEEVEDDDDDSDPNFARATRAADAAEDDLSCVDCGKDFDTVRGLLVHRVRKHGEGGAGANYSGILHCRFCDKEFTKNRAMQEHIDGEHLKKRFQCTIGSCKVRVKWRPDILKHMKEKHKMRLTMVDCMGRGLVTVVSLSDSEFEEENSRRLARYKNGLPKKKKIESDPHGRVLKPRPPPLPPRTPPRTPPASFPSPSKRKSPHKSYTIVNGLLQCNLCEFNTKYNSNLRRHEKFAHNFKSLRGRKRSASNGHHHHHRPFHHQTPPAPLTELANGETAFRSGARLEDSFRVLVVSIGGERMYKCSACETVSPRADTIRIHINAIHRQIRYRCTICNDYTTRYMTSFRGHVQNVHQLYDSCRQYAFEFSELDPPDFNEASFARAVEDGAGFAPYGGGGGGCGADDSIYDPDSSNQGFPSSNRDDPYGASSFDDEDRSVYTPNRFLDPRFEDRDLDETMERDSLLRQNRPTFADDLVDPFGQELAPMASPSSATPVQAGDETLCCAMPDDAFATNLDCLSAPSRRPHSFVDLLSVDPMDLEARERQAASPACPSPACPSPACPSPACTILSSSNGDAKGSEAGEIADSESIVDAAMEDAGAGEDDTGDDASVEGEFAGDNESFKPKDEIASSKINVDSSLNMEITRVEELSKLEIREKSSLSTELNDASSSKTEINTKEESSNLQTTVDAPLLTTKAIDASLKTEISADEKSPTTEIQTKDESPDGVAVAVGDERDGRVANGEEPKPDEPMEVDDDDDDENSKSSVHQLKEEESKKESREESKNLIKSENSSFILKEENIRTVERRSSAANPKEGRSLSVNTKEEGRSSSVNPKEEGRSSSVNPKEGRSSSAEPREEVRSSLVDKRDERSSSDDFALVKDEPASPVYSRILSEPKAFKSLSDSGPIDLTPLASGNVSLSLPSTGDSISLSTNTTVKSQSISDSPVDLTTQNDSISFGPKSDSIFSASDSVTLKRDFPSARENDSLSIVPQNDSLFDASQNDSPSVVPKTDSLSMAHENDSLSLAPESDSASLSAHSTLKNDSVSLFNSPEAQLKNDSLSLEVSTTKDA